MRILIATNGHYSDRPSGSAKVALDEAVELSRRGESVWVIAPGVPSLPEHELKDGIHFLRYVPAKVAPWKPARSSSHQKAATAVLMRHLPQVDAIHGHIPLSYLAAQDFYGDSVHSCYTIHSPARMEMAIEWRNSSFLRRMTAPFGLAMINRIENECLRRSRVITALSQYTIDCVGKIHGEDLAKMVRLIPGWVDTSRFVPVDDRKIAKARLGWPLDLPVLFTLRRLVARMGLDRLLDASHRLIGEGLKFHLMIGGSGPLRGKLEEQARTLGLRDSVTFLGRIEDRDLPLAYAACDAFLLPTAELECFGLIALEALSAGRPVLATPVGAIPEVIRKFDSSWLARSAEAADIAGVLRQYLTGNLQEHAPAQLHDQIHRDYSRERVLGEFIETSLGRKKHYSGAVSIRENPVPADGGECTRVLVCVGAYLPGYKAGGPIRSIENLVAALGKEVQFRIVTRDRDLGDTAPYPGIVENHWARLGHADVMYVRPGWQGLRGTFALLRSADRGTVVYLNSYFSRCFSMLAIFMCWLGICRPLRIVLAPRGELSPGGLALKKRRKRLYIQLSRWLGLHKRVIWHASSEWEAADIRRQYSGLPIIDVAAVLQSSSNDNSGKTRGVIGTAPDIAANGSLIEERRSKKKGALRVVFVSRISRMKNLSTALMMLSGVRGDVSFDIYGPAEDIIYWAECQRLISGLPANVRVEYWGRIEHEKIGRVFAEHDLFLLPTLGENYGHVICESLAAGCPVLISDQTPWRDLEKHGAGWDIPLKETGRFRSILQQCVDADGEWCAALSASAKRYGESVTSSPEIIDANRRLFQYASTPV